jgi:RNA polymerase sigma factor (sigma-70 family)
MSKKSYKPSKPPAGPPEVKPWHTLTRAEPCVLDRKFGYVKTRHKNLAKAERQLAEVSALPANQRHPDAIHHLTDRVARQRAWLLYSIQTLEEHCKFAVARLDGTLDKVRPLRTKTGKTRKWGSTGGSGRGRNTKDVRRKVEYLRSELPAYIACCAVAAGTSDQNEAMKLLMQIAKPVVEKVKRESGREPELAEQLAWNYLWEKTAVKFNPASKKANMAKFNTYFTSHAKRATQIRTRNDAPPGRMKINGKFVARASLHTGDDDRDSALFHPGTYDEDSTTRGAVAAALGRLTEEERSFAFLRFVERTSLRKIAEDGGLSVHHVRRLEKEIGEKLRGFLCDFAVE